MARLLHFDRFAGFCNLTRFFRIKFFKNYHIFTEGTNIVLLNFISHAQLDLRHFSIFKNLSYSDFSRIGQIVQKILMELFQSFICVFSLKFNFQFLGINACPICYHKKKITAKQLWSSVVSSVAYIIRFSLYKQSVNQSSQDYGFGVSVPAENYSTYQ